jgi:hypothetical protein
MVMLDAPLANAMFAPATRDTLEELAFNEKLVAAGTDGPTTVIDPTPVFRVILAPAANTIVPVEVAAPVPNADTTLAVVADKISVFPLVLIAPLMIPCAEITRELE